MAKLDDKKVAAIKGPEPGKTVMRVRDGLADGLFPSRDQAHEQTGRRTRVEVMGILLDKAEPQAWLHWHGALGAHTAERRTENAARAIRQGSAEACRRTSGNGRSGARPRGSEPRQEGSTGRVEDRYLCRCFRRIYEDRLHLEKPFQRQAPQAMAVQLGPSRYPEDGRKACGHDHD